MVKNKEIATAFKNGSETARTEHLFIEKNVIYSYGYHFPIAIKLSNNNLIFNKDGYSNTTARHKGLIKREFSDFNIIEMNTEQLKDIIQKGIKDINDLSIIELSKEI